MQTFGYETLISILLPGFTLLGAAWLLLARFLARSPLYSLLSQTLNSEWQFTLLVLLCSALLGTLLAVVLDWLEWRIFDRWTGRRLRIDQDLYDEEWYCYVGSLVKDANPYLERKLLYFYFEFRAGVAVLLFAITWLAVGTSVTTTWIPGVVGVVIAGLLLYIASATHVLLAFWRHRLFEACARKRLTP